MDDEYLSLSQGLTQPSGDVDMVYSSRKRKIYTTGFSKRRKLAKAKLFSKRYGRKSGKSRFARSVMSVVNRNAETKTQMIQLVQNDTLEHNTVRNITNNAFQIQLGTAGEKVGTGATPGGVRIGDKCYVKGLKVSLYVESQQYRPQVTYWLYLVRNLNDPGSDIANRLDMFEGVSTTLPCDFIDSSKVHVLFAKKFTLRMPNSGTTAVMGTGGGVPPSHDGFAIADDTTITNPKRAMKFYVPINRQIRFKDWQDVQNEPVASCRYQWVMCAYDTYTSVSGGTTYPVGHVTMATKVYFTDV